MYQDLKISRVSRTFIPKIPKSICVCISKMPKMYNYLFTNMLPIYVCDLNARSYRDLLEKRFLYILLMMTDRRGCDLCPASCKYYSSINLLSSVWFRGETSVGHGNPYRLLVSTKFQVENLVSSRRNFENS